MVRFHHNSGMSGDPRAVQEARLSYSKAQVGRITSGEPWKTTNFFISRRIIMKHEIFVRYSQGDQAWYWICSCSDAQRGFSTKVQAEMVGSGHKLKKN